MELGRGGAGGKVGDTGGDGTVGGDGGVGGSVGDGGLGGSGGHLGGGGEGHLGGGGEGGGKTENVGGRQPRRNTNEAGVEAADRSWMPTILMCLCYINGHSCTKPKTLE